MLDLADDETSARASREVGRRGGKGSYEVKAKLRFECSSTCYKAQVKQGVQLFEGCRALGSKD